MEPKETQSLHQSQPPNLNQTPIETPQTVRMGGSSPLSSSSGSGEVESQPGLWAGLRLPLKRTAIVVSGLFIIALILSGLFNVAKSIIAGFSKPQPLATSQPQIEPSVSPAPTTAISPENKCLDLPTRMSKAKIVAADVDKLFYQKYPDRVNKPLTTDTVTERNLRQEWCAIANQLIDKK
ncbi:hypothetical protein [Chamaesiphon polymorphus]|uniref:Uncharacterized protein n=1 Tax=Chamaesiphon polymorphus CCALA 037 TaxID=2107692 RepID=A0A2T1GG42_9CYAN|nr:hypothetical protein [Chamaesiphon polymorphus]PSB56614.1 hypothetical protein C7B77_11325 [Chamaesiphon polymorphus CCALA 037]